MRRMLDENKELREQSEQLRKENIRLSDDKGE
jgi:hypothetical protein